MAPNTLSVIFLIMALYNGAKSSPLPSSETTFMKNHLFILNICDKNCDEEQSRVAVPQYCKEGCRFYNYNVSLVAASISNAPMCKQLCAGRYDNQTAELAACCVGCDEADEVSKYVEKISLWWLEVSEKKSMFSHSLFEWMSSISWPVSTGSAKKSSDRKPKSAEPAKLKATSSDWSSGQNGLSKGLNKYPRPKGGEKVENSAGWAYYTSYIILTVGTTILVSLVCYSMSAVRRYEESDKYGQESEHPPSYEVVMRAGPFMFPRVEEAIPLSATSPETPDQV